MLGAEITSNELESG